MNKYIGVIIDPTKDNEFFVKTRRSYNNITPFIITNYVNKNEVYIKFLDKNEYITKTDMTSLKRNSIKNPFQPFIYGVGYLGLNKENNHMTKDKNGKFTKCYNTWKDMLRRCYDDNYHKRCPSYINCKVCEKWLNFDNFASWYDKNFYQVDDEIMCLDKDIIKKNNIIYSPKNCIFVPDTINKLFIKQKEKRGNLSIGVSIIKSGKFRGQIDLENGEQIRKYFNTEKEAFQWYKKQKEKKIKRIAKLYKDKIPKKLYLSITKYSIEEND